jgi:hypothetical protein
MVYKLAGGKSSIVSIGIKIDGGFDTRVKRARRHQLATKKSLLCIAGNEIESNKSDEGRSKLHVKHKSALNLRNLCMNVSKDNTKLAQNKEKKNGDRCMDAGGMHGGLSEKVQVSYGSSSCSRSSLYIIVVAIYFVLVSEFIK